VGAERREEEMMSTQKGKTSYPAVQHLKSFHEAVFNFITLKEAEGKKVAKALMTDCITKSAVGGDGEEIEYAPRTSALQEKAFDSLWVYLNDAALLRNSEAFEALWVTAGV
jgi:hypothetical protein